ncbi:MAG: glycosyltransferase family 39 protein [Lachnospiraceae bacterium]|nr:glycosyltransferase family 39 protein [Lachnospiraceae bacterium]
MKHLKKNKFLHLMVAIFLLKGIFYGVYAIPLHMGSTPDDVGHLSYVAYMAKEHKIPVLFKTKFEETSYRNYDDVLKNRDVIDSNYLINEGEYRESEDYNYIAQHPPLYHLYLLPFYLVTTMFTSQLSNIVIVLRLATIPLGIITLLCLYKTLELLNAGDIAKKCAIVCFTFSSAMQYFLTIVDNDAMVICLSSVSFYLFIKYLKQANIKDLYLFAAASGGIVITKYTGAVVLPAYALIYLYHCVVRKKQKLSDFTKQSAICLAIFGVMVAPVLIQNYVRYELLFPKYDSFEMRYNYSLYQFISKIKYFDIMFRNIVNYTGWMVMVVTSKTMKVLCSLIVSYIFFLKSTKFKGLWFIPFVTATIISLELSMEYLTGFIISVISCIMLLSISKYDLTSQQDKDDKEVCILSLAMILSYVIVVFVSQYKLFVAYGMARALHGRYYYVLVLPFFWLIFRNLNLYNEKATKYLPAITFLMCIYSETILAYLGMMQW